MSTLASSVFDLFMLNVSDYRLISLFQTSGSDTFGAYLQPWLLRSIQKFDICDQSLDYNSASQSFTVDLTQKNLNILAQLMVEFWMQKEVNDVLQIRQKLQDKELKTYSEAQNFTSKQNNLNLIRESNSQMLVEYGIKTNNWTYWKNQVFD